MPTWQVVLLGLIEGLTEFLPVSSTGHVVLAGHFLGFHSPGKTFEILIQLGAILAIVTVYFAKLWQMARDLPHDKATQRFVLSILLAFFPAMVLGAALNTYIDAMLNKPEIICVSLILGGIVLLVMDRVPLTPSISQVEHIPPSMALKIGLCQCLAMIPGVSRSGATIVGAMLMGTDKRTAAEFSFFLAMPTMAGAFAFKLWKSWPDLSADDAFAIALGFVVSFVCAVIVVRKLLDYVSHYGFSLFGWWRILVGVAGLIGLFALGEIWTTAGPVAG
jgi:undecaprenyl-diphosphatase